MTDKAPAQKYMTPLEQQWREWHEKNPHVYRLFDRFTREAIRRGHLRLSAWLIINRVRWETSVVTTDDDFRISNDYIAYYSREFMKLNPEYDGFFCGKGDETMTAEGRKDDAQKARYDLLPPELMDGTARVLAFGAAKYGERNWEQGMGWGRVFAALMRHMWAWWRGEDADAETGMSHLWHAACCIAFLMAYEARGIGHDDRPSKKSS